MISRSSIPKAAASRAVGAVLAQCSQALGSFVLMVIAARTLGLEGLGIFALVYGVMVLLTAGMSGFVGDSLTVLDRRDPPVRGALEGWCLAIATTAGVVGSGALAAFGLISGTEAILFAVATSLFLVEDSLRRILMAEMLFLRIVVVDVSGFAAGLLVLLLWSATAPLELASFLAAIAGGQAVGLVIGAAALPVEERYVVPLARSWSAYRRVAAFGVWRAAQQSVRPALLTGMRLTVVVVAGMAATGALEGARIYIAPAMLLITGVSSYLFASFAKQSTTPLANLLTAADRGVLILVCVTAAGGAAAIFALPVLGPLVTGRGLDLWAVIGWLAYAASVAAVTPYGVLAAVRGKQALLFGIRLADSILSLSLVMLLLSFGYSFVLAPLLLVSGSLAGGLAIRRFLLRPLLIAEQAGNPQGNFTRERRSTVHV